MVSLGLTVSGTIAGGITLNPIILGCISGSYILIQGYLSKSNTKTKTDICRFAYTVEIIFTWSAIWWIDITEWS